MSCGVSYLRRRSATFHEEIKRLVSRDLVAFEITGTWDFKWPLGSTIRVAFQTPNQNSSISAEDFSTAKSEIIRLASVWQAFLPKSSGISFDFTLPDLDPALDDDGGERRHRSSFSAREDDRIDYDVLVSLDDLPIVLVDPLQVEGSSRDNIIFPIAELGTYSRRVDYGVPSVYLGRFGRFLSMTLVEYFKSLIGQHVVTHEFGHVLGLGHMHQHPELVPFAYDGELEEQRLQAMDAARRDYYKNAPAVKRLMARILGIDVTKVTDEQVASHVLRGWRGNLRFSDWPKLTQDDIWAHQQNGTLRSVMLPPAYKCMRENHSICAACSQQSIEIPADTPTEPSSLDRAALALMYDRSAPGRKFDRLKRVGVSVTNSQLPAPSESPR